MPESGGQGQKSRQPIPGYELVKKLGEGGMAATYLARQANMDRLVAIKIMRRNLSRDASFITRFEREAKLAGSLDHVNIVGVHDVGEGGGFHYMAMEYVEGKSAYDLMPDTGGMDEELALHITMQVTRALDFAHKAGIIHRDIKPDNILVTENNVAKVCDFGLARHTAEETRMTQTGIMMGTPHYVSPEQARGDKDVDIRSDIYSLGATLYHFVTGETPFQGSSAAVVMTKHLTEELPWPADVNPLVSENVCRLIEKMMAKEREYRYADPAELITDLELVIDGKAPESEMLAAGRSSIGRRGTSDVKPAPQLRPRRMSEDAGTAGRLLEPVGKKMLPKPVLYAIGAGVLFLLGVGMWAMMRSNGEPDGRQVAAQKEAAAEKAWREKVLPGAKEVLSREEALALRDALAAFAARHGETEFGREKAGEVGRLKALAEKALAGPVKPEDDKKLREMYEYAEGWWKKHPGDYKEATAKFERVRKSGSGTKWELQAGDAISEIETARSKAADAAFAPLKEKAGNLAEAGDYDGATAVFGKPPAKFADLLKPRFEAERKKLKETAEAKLTAAIAAAEGFSKDGHPEKGLAELEKVKAVKYAALAGKLAALATRLEKESADVAGKLAKQKQAEARKALERILAKYDELILAGKYKDAGECLSRERKGLDADVLKAMPAGLAAAEKVSGLLATWQAGKHDALKKLIGKDVVLRTRVGMPTKGTVQAITDDAFKVKVTFRIGGTEGSSVRTVRFADLAEGELEKLLPPFKPRDAEGHLAAMLLALSRKDAPGAEKAVKAAGEHPLAGRYARHLDVLKLGAKEAAAKRAWQEDVGRLVRTKYDKTSGKAMLAALDLYAKEHGGTKFAKGKEKDIAALKSAARLPLGPILYTKFPFDAKEAARRQKETAEGLGLPATKTVDLGKGVKLELVLVPAGDFLMGPKYTPEELERRGPGLLSYYKREVPRHKVRITKPYYLGKYEVTQAQWERVMGKNPSKFKDAKNPVEQVNWNDCQGFIKKLNETFKGKMAFRLPTEAEWEQACRAGTDTPFWFGEKITTDLANYNGQRGPWDGYKGQNRGKTTAVGSFKPNPWGLHDTAGNVWEWCEDWYGAYPKEDQTDPKGPEKGSDRVLRGGSWNNPLPGKCRSAFRGHFYPSTRFNNYGLRVLVVVPSRGLEPAPPPPPSKKGAFRAEWKQLKMAGDKPVRRRSIAMAMTYDSKRKRAVLFGGRLGGRSLNDLWALDLARMRWTRLQKNDPKDPAIAAGQRPAATRDHHFTYDSVNDLYWLRFDWVYDPKVSKWKKRTGDITGLRVRLKFGPAPGWAYDPDGKRFMLWNGPGAILYPATNKGEPLPTGPPGRFAHGGLAYDRQNKVFVLFGGSISKVGLQNDTWTFDPRTKKWREMKPPASPSRRYYHKLVWHDRLGALVMFGGRTGKDKKGNSLSVSDLWVYETAANRWTEITTPTAPPPAVGATTYAAAHDRLVLFNYKGQTWTCKIERVKKK